MRYGLRTGQTWMEGYHRIGPQIHPVWPFGTTDHPLISAILITHNSSLQRPLFNIRSLHRIRVGGQEHAHDHDPALPVAAFERALRVARPRLDDGAELPILANLDRRVVQMAARNPHQPVIVNADHPVDRIRSEEHSLNSS